MARRHDLFACGGEDKFYMWKRIGIMRIIISRMGIIILVRGNIFYSYSWQYFLFLFVAVIIVIILIRFFFAYGITRITMNGPRITHEYYYMEHYMGHYMWITCSVADKNNL